MPKRRTFVGAEYEEAKGDLGPLFGRPPPLHANPRPTEVDAARRVAPIAGKLRALVLEWVRREGARGLTSKEAGRQLAAIREHEKDNGSDRYSAAPRLTELAEAGLIVDSGERRERAIVWIAAEVTRALR